MTTDKEKITRLLDTLPDDSSYEEIVREIAFSMIVERGLKDIEEGRIISHEELSKRIKQW